MWEESLEDLSTSLHEKNFVLKTYKTKYESYLSIVKAFPVFLASLITASISIFVYLVIYKLDIIFIIVPIVALVVVCCLTLFCSNKVKNYTFLINNTEKSIRPVQREIVQRTERARKQFIYLRTAGNEPKADYTNVHFFSDPKTYLKMRDLSLLEGGPRTRLDMEYVDNETVKEIDDTSDLYTRYNSKCYSVFLHSKPVIEDRSAHSIVYNTIMKKRDPPLTMEEKVRVVVKTVLNENDATKYHPNLVDEREQDLYVALRAPDDTFSDILKMKELVTEIIDLEKTRHEVAERMMKINDRISFQFQKLPDY